jgi:hypothetical protein
MITCFAPLDSSNHMFNCSYTIQISPFLCKSIYLYIAGSFYIRALRSGLISLNKWGPGCIFPMLPVYNRGSACSDTLNTRSRRRDVVRRAVRSHPTLSDPNFSIGDWLVHFKPLYSAVFVFCHLIYSNLHFI